MQALLAGGPIVTQIVIISSIGSSKQLENCKGHTTSVYLFKNLTDCIFTPDAFREHSATLDALLHTAGRKPSDVRRTMMNGLVFGRDMGELDRRLSWRHNQSELAGKPLETVLETLHASQGVIVGTPVLYDR